MDEEEANTFVDGCGVFKDTVIGKGTRIRFRLAEDRQQDISVFVEDGMLHIYGMYRPLSLGLTGEQNYVNVDTQVWTIEKEEEQAA